MPCTVDLFDGPEDRQHQEAAKHRITLAKIRGAEEPDVRDIISGFYKGWHEVQDLCEEIKDFGGSVKIRTLFDENPKDADLAELYAWALKHESNDSIREAAEKRSELAEMALLAVAEKSKTEEEEKEEDLSLVDLETGQIHLASARKELEEEKWIIYELLDYRKSSDIPEWKNSIKTWDSFKPKKMANFLTLYGDNHTYKGLKKRLKKWKLNLDSDFERWCNDGPIIKIYEIEGRQYVRKVRAHRRKNRMAMVQITGYPLPAHLEEMTVEDHLKEAKAEAEDTGTPQVIYDENSELLEGEQYYHIGYSEDDGHYLVRALSKDNLGEDPYELIPLDRVRSEMPDTYTILKVWVALRDTIEDPDNVRNEPWISDATLSKLSQALTHRQNQSGEWKPIDPEIKIGKAFLNPFRNPWLF